MATIGTWRSRVFWRLLGALAVIAGGIASCTATHGDAARLSGAVAFVKETPEAVSFLETPGVAYVETYMRFGPALGDDVIMFVDQELLEGLAKHRWVKGGDWMALVGVQRAGGVWVGGGTQKTMRGEPSKERKWAIHDLKQRLEPDTWYRMRTVADFAKRRFVSFTIQGGKINRTIDISDVPLDYPNYMPFDRTSMIYIVGAMRSRAMMKQEGTPLVYFDDVEGGIVRADGSTQRMFFDDFESQKTVGAQPITLPSISLSKYALGKWYLERDESIFRIEPAPFARSGRHVGVADVRLSD